MKRVSFAIIIVLVSSLVLSAQKLVRDHDIVPEDYLAQAFIYDVTASADGKYAAYAEWRWDEYKDARNADLWVVDIKNAAALRLTSELSNETSPQWSPDGDYLYFIGHFKQPGAEDPPNDGSSQVWRIHPDGSGLMPITRVPDGIDDYQLSADGKNIYYLVSKDHMIDDWKDLRSEYKGELEFGHGIHLVSEVWKLNMTTWREEMLLDHDRYIRYFAVSPNQYRIALISDPDDELITHEGQSKVEVFNTRSKEITAPEDKLWRAEAPSPFGWLSDLAWSDDSKLLAFTIDFDGYPQEIFVMEFSGKSDETSVNKLNRPPEVHAAGGLEWLPDKYVIAFTGEWKARQHVYTIDYKSGATKNLTPGDVVVNGFDFAGVKGGLVVVQNTLTYYNDIVFYDAKGKSRRLTNVTPQVDTWKLPQTSIVKWQGAEGDWVEGILELPPDYKEGDGPLPLVVNLHGGPTASEKYCFLFWIYGRAALASRGYAMFAPNYRGSTGYGDKFMTDLIGHENNYDVKDIMTGIDYLVEQGIADEERLGVMGWSNGGYLTNCLIASNRFKAASSGAGVFDMVMQWGEEDTPGHVVNYMQGLPWEKPDAYRKASPLFTLHSEVKTPTLIHVGKNDPRVPPTQSKALHRAMRHYIDAPCELIIYPGAGHGLRTYKHRLAKMKWDHAWFDKYLPLDKK